MEIAAKANARVLPFLSSEDAGLAKLHETLAVKLVSAKWTLFWRKLGFVFLMVVFVAWSVFLGAVDVLAVPIFILLAWIFSICRCCQPKGADVAAVIVDGPKPGCCNSKPMHPFDTTHALWKRLKFREYFPVGYGWDSITKKEVTSDLRVIPTALTHCAQPNVNPNPTRAMELLHALLNDDHKPCCGGGGGYDVEATRALVAPQAVMLLSAERRTAPFALKQTAACCPNELHDVEGPIRALTALMPHPSLASPALFPDAALADAARLAISKLGVKERRYKVEFGDAVLAALAARMRAPPLEVAVVAAGAEAGAEKPAAAVVDV